MTVSVLPTGLGLQRPFGAALQLTDPVFGDTVGRTLLVWPAPPANDDLVDAVDLSALDVPNYVAGPGGQPSDTVGVDVAVEHATWEPDELALMPGVADGNPDIQDAGSVWYRYTSTSFAGRLGYRLIDPTNQGWLRVAAYMSADAAAPPGAVSDLVAAPGNTWPPSDLSHVRMEPGHAVWFQVYTAAPLVGSTAGPARLELFRAPNEQDDITNAYDGSFGGWGAEDVGGMGWGGDGDTYHVTADAGRGANLWFTTLVTATGHVRMLVSSEDMRGAASQRPFALALYRAPSTARVTDTSALGDPVTTLDSTIQTPNGQDQAVVSFEGDLTPGRYYWSIERGQGDQPTWFALGANYFPSTGGDTDPPETSITAKPASPTRDADLVFEFDADEAGASFECAVDGGAFTGCTSPFTITGAAEGERTFAVRATDAAGNTDPTPAEATVVVDRTGPTVTITGAPTGTVAESSATLHVRSSELVGKGGFACTLSAGGTSADYPCDSPQAGDGDATTVALADLPDGEVTFCARAWDQAGNRSAQACATWTVAIPPVVTINAPQQGAEFQASDVPALDYTCTDNGGTVASEDVTVDGQPSAAGDPLPTGLGEHTVSVTCTDPAGNAATAQATYTVVPPANRPPVTVDDTLTITAGQTLPVDLLGNDSDPDGDQLTIASFYRPGGSGPGTLACVTNSCTYSAPATASGTDTWAYRVSDGKGGLTEGTLTVTITAPTSTADHVAVRLSGGLTLEAEGDIVCCGDYRVVRDASGVKSVKGNGSVVIGGVTTSVSFDINRVWTTPRWSGTVRVKNTALGIDVRVPFSGTLTSAPDGTVSGSASWFQLRVFPFPPTFTRYTLTFSVLDRG